MIVSSEHPPRRRRYTRMADGSVCALTPARCAILRFVAELRMLSLPQVARLTCPSEKSARRHCRVLFDSGLLSVVPVARVALAANGAANDSSLLYGSAPNVYILTTAGLRALERLGWDGEAAAPPPYGPKNSLFLGHELAVRDIRVWLELLTRRYPGHALERWVDGPSASVDLKRSHTPKVVHPDAWFVYRLGGKAMVGFLEMDMGTERGLVRWKAKLDAYRILYTTERLRELTGYVNARVLVVTPNSRRRDQLAELVGQHATPELAARFWLMQHSELADPDFSRAVWRQPGSQLLRPLLPKEVVDAY